GVCSSRSPSAAPPIMAATWLARCRVCADSSVHMIRTLALAALLALCACARHDPTPPPPVAPAPAPATNTQSPAAPQTGALPAPPGAAQSESQQAAASQESVETEGQRPARRDTSIEQFAELPPGAQRPDRNR